MKYKVLAFDIDGTLTNSEKKITDKTKNAILAAAKQGCIIAVASGRPVKGVLGVAEELNLKENNGYILSLNGGIIISCKDGKIVHDMKLSKEYCREICSEAEKYPDTVLLTYEGDDVITEHPDDKYVEIECRINGLGCRKVDNLKNYLDFPVNKFLLVGEGNYMAEVEKSVYAKLHERMDVYRSEPFFLEILPKDVNKAKALEKLLKTLGIDREELMAFGDGFNDLSMIQYAGMGVAMANGNDIVKENADYIAPSNDEDGIVEVLEKFVLD